MAEHRPIGPSASTEDKTTEVHPIEASTTSTEAEMIKLRPIVGVGVFVFNNKGEFCIGKRKGSHGAGTWGLPGGHLEYRESFAGCAEREVLEETNLLIKDVRFLTATNDADTKKDPRHGVTIFMTAKLQNENAIAELLEPNKCEGWRWQKFQAIKDNHHHLKEKKEQVHEEYFAPLYNMVDQAPEAVETVSNWKS